MKDEEPASFDRQWQERFKRFAALREDDAGIAGWSPSGLDTRFRFFRRHWEPAPAGSTILDVGCGAATYTRWLADQGVRPIGVDYSHPTLLKARARTPASIPLCAADATRLPFRDACFDGVVCLGLLQAVSDPGIVVRELARVLKPGGTLWIDALNRAGLAALWQRARLRLKGKRMHLRYDSAPVLARTLARSGFDEVKRFWLPIMPARVQALQPLVESHGVVASVPIVRSLISHAIVFSAQRSVRHAEATRIT